MISVLPASLLLVVFFGLLTVHAAFLGVVWVRSTILQELESNKKEIEGGKFLSSTYGEINLTRGLKRKFRDELEGVKRKGVSLSGGIATDFKEHIFFSICGIFLILVREIQLSWYFLEIIFVLILCVSCFLLYWSAKLHSDLIKLPLALDRKFDEVIHQTILETGITRLKKLKRER